MVQCPRYLFKLLRLPFNALLCSHTRFHFNCQELRRKLLIDRQELGEAPIRIECGWSGGESADLDLFIVSAFSVIDWTRLLADPIWDCSKLVEKSNIITYIHTTLFCSMLVYQFQWNKGMSCRIPAIDFQAGLKFRRKTKNWMYNSWNMFIKSRELHGKLIQHAVTINIF